MEEAEDAASSRRGRSKHGALGASKQALVKRELDQMLDYKRQQLRDLDDTSNGKAAGPTMRSIREDLEMVRQQVDTLEAHLRSREEILARLREEVEQEKATR